MAVVVAVVSLAAGIYSATRTVTVPGQKLGDISRQTAKEGEPRLIVWGIVRPIGGNVVAVQEPPRIERRRQRSGGKGSGGSRTTSEHPRRTYAIGVCEGPITGFRRIWRNNKLVYDGRPGSEWGAANNHVFTRVARFYYGGYNQMPSPDLEAVFGVGNVPAMRGTAYLVMVDEDLTDTNGAIPQWQFEVARAEGLLLTSRPYELESVESAAAAARVAKTEFKQVLRAGFGSEPAEASAAASKVEFRAVLFDLGGQPAEEVVSAAAATRVDFRNVLVNADLGLENVQMLPPKATRIYLHEVLVPFTQSEPESAAMAPAVSRVFLNEQ